MDGKSLIAALNLLEQEKKITKASIIEGIKQALDRAYKKEVDPEATIEVDVSETTGEIKVYKLMKVVKEEDIEDDLTEISLEEARKLDITLGLGDSYKKPIPMNDFSRIAALHVKQVIKQKISEEQKDVILTEWSPKIGTVINATVEKVDSTSKGVVVELGNTFGYAPATELIPDERIEPGKMYKFYIKDVRQSSKSWPILLSRTDPGFVKYLMTVEVPEIQDGSIEIKAVARNPGERAKLAVKSNNPSLDAIGSCIGRKGARITNLTSQLKNEKIDVIL
jgi:N utilization substance protein A